MTLQTDLSELLNALGQTPGDILLRGPSLWTSLPAGPPGWVLTSTGALTLPAWLPNNPFSPLTPPSLAEFPILFGNPALTKEAGAAGAFCFSLSPATSNGATDAWLKLLPAPPRQYTMLQTAIIHQPTLYGAGLVIADAATPRLITAQVRGAGSANVAALSIRRWNATGSLNADIFANNYDGAVSIWTRLTDDGVNFKIEFSIGGAAWITALNESRTAWLTAPDRLGPCVTEAAGLLFGANVAVLAWSETIV